MKNKIIGSILIMAILILGGVLVNQVKAAGTQNEQARMYVDSPRQNAQIIGNTLEIKGWVMAKEKNTTVKVYMDGQEMIEKVARHQRPDVLVAIQGYGTVSENPYPGFQTKIDIQNKKDGKQHNITIKVFSSKGNLLLEYTQKNVFANYQAKAYIDNPRTETIKTKMDVKGWYLSEDSKANIQIMIDGTEQKNLSIMRETRQDVLSAISGYGGKEKNPTPGFKTQIDTSTLKDGVHTLKVNVISRTGQVIQSTSRTITVKKYPTRLYIDSPRKETIKTNMAVKGWVLTEDTKASIQVAIDGTVQQGLVITRGERQDVLNSILGYGGKQFNPKPGFTCNVNTSNLKDGNHTLKISVISQTGEILETISKQITVKKYEAKIYIDTPRKENVKLDMTIQGWYLSEDEKATMKVFVDGTEQKDLTITRQTRQDVLNAISGYGGKEKNPKPGFTTTKINTSALKDGTHTLKIDLISRTGETIQTLNKSFTVKKYDAKVYLDKPTATQPNRNNTMIIKGWEMSEHSTSTVKITIDGQAISSVIRQEREDVLSAIKDYGGRTTNSKPGFYVETNISKLKEGTHTLKVEVLSGTNEVMTSITRKILIDRSYLLGIDVSQHNGKIDWQKVKESGIGFAIIRCGYGKNMTSQDDPRFLENIQACERLGIPYGVYIYSYAGDRAGARSEAEHMIRLLNGRNPTFGVWLDMEDADGYKVRNNITTEDCIQVSEEFCTIMKNKGYKVGIYASLDWLTTKLNDNRLKSFPKWVAQWNSQCDYEEKYVMWQYTSSGKVEGITGNVDMNKWYGY